MRAVIVATLLASILRASTPLDAQVVRGRVVESISGAPVRAAVVSLLVRDSTPTNRRALTNADGNFAITTPNGGDFVIEARAIGFRRIRQLVHLDAGSTSSLELRLERTDLTLSSVRVEGRRNCRAPERFAGTTSALWDDVWSALSATTFADDSSTTRYAAFRYRRTLDVADGRVVEEFRQQRESVAPSLFAAAAPRDLEKLGFIHEDDAGNLEVFAPDARTFLSNEFIGGHCFASTREDSTASSPARVGIAFWPQRSWTTRGIEGVFWLDPRSRELTRIEFGYPALGAFVVSSVSIDSMRFGGIVNFSRSDAGRWFVSRWQIRAPILMRSNRYLVINGRRVEQDPHDSVAAISEEGGIVLTEATHLASIRGRVTDPASGESTTGSTVELPGVLDRIALDSGGTYEIANLLPGRYHLRLSRPGAEGRRALWHTAVVDVLEGEAVQHDVVIADERVAARAACPASSQRDVATVALHAVVRDARTRQLLRGRAIELQWLRMQIEGRSQSIGLKRELQTLTTDSYGAFTTCRVPARADINLRDPNERTASWSEPLRLDEVMSVLDIAIDSSGVIGDVDGGLQTTRVATGNPLRVPDAPRETGTLSGIVVSDDSLSTPLANVEVRIEGANRITTTDGAGRFTIASLATGTHIVSFRALGFTPTTQSVDIREGEGTVEQFRLGRVTTVLRALRVTGESDAPSVGLQEFRDRERAGFGKFVSPEDIEKAGDTQLAPFLMARVQGFEFVPLNRGSMSTGLGLVSRRFTSLSRGVGPPKPCFAQVFIDGARVNGMQNEAWDFSQLKLTDVAAMEFYRSASETPTLFGGPGAACGTVVIWTRAGKSKK